MHSLTYAPVVDLGRDARWPRMWENYGEDCYVNTEMGRESVIGFQGEDPNHIGPNRVAAYGLWCPRIRQRSYAIVYHGAGDA